jgi:hypothetical protein
MIGCMVSVLCVLAAGAATVASADPVKDRAALTQFEAAYQATAKLSGAARTNQACLDAAKLTTAGAAFSHDIAPADSPVDDVTWGGIARGLGGSLDSLVKVCKTPDRKLPLLGTDFETADEIVKNLDVDVQAVLNSARPRTLSPALKTAQTAISAMLASSTSICSQLPKLAKALGQAAKPPAGVAAAVWKEPYQTVKNIADDLKPAACGKRRAADEQIGSALGELHDNFCKLVLLVPPR